jgi:hypothetical protein
VDPLLLSFRLLHIVAGVLWVGFAVFTALYLGPAVQEVGPDGGKVMLALQRRKLLTVLPLLALGTLLSGFWLYWKVSMGFAPSYMGSRVGMTIGTGAVAALAGYALGIAVMRPAILKAMALSQPPAVPESDADRAARMAMAGRYRARAAAMGRIVSALLLLATAAMAIARYW